MRAEDRGRGAEWDEVGMGSVVTKSFEEDGIVIMGNPARVYTK